MRATELRRAYTEFFTRPGAHARPLVEPDPDHPSAPMFTNSGMMQFVPYFLGEEAVPFDPSGPPRCRSACGPAASTTTSTPSAGRCATSASSRCSATSASATTSRPRPSLGVGVRHRGARHRPDRMWITVHVTTTRPSALGESAGLPRRAHPAARQGQLLGDGRHRPVRPQLGAVLRLRPRAGVPTAARPTRRRGALRRVLEPGLPPVLPPARRQPHRPRGPGIDTGAGLERILGVLQGSPASTSPTSLSPLVDEAQSVTGRARRAPTSATSPCGCSPTTPAPCRSWSPTACSRPTRTAATCCAASSAGRSASPTCSASSQLVCPRWSSAASRSWATTTPSSWEPRPGARHRHPRGGPLPPDPRKTGSQTLDTELDELPEGGELPGAVAFQLHDTYGFPLEVTQEIAELKGVDVDVAGFDAAMAEQRERAKAARKGGRGGHRRRGGRAVTSPCSPSTARPPSPAATRSSRRPRSSAGSATRSSSTAPRSTPSPAARSATPVASPPPPAPPRCSTPPTPCPGLHRHHIRWSRAPSRSARRSRPPSTPSAAPPSAQPHRHPHPALGPAGGPRRPREAAGLAGSPRPAALRLQPLRGAHPDQIAAIEDLANREILANAPVRHFETSMADAEQLGAIAFFGEKYGETVRVLEAGRALGRAVRRHPRRALGDIGPIKIISEGSIGSNIRRIEAITGTGPDRAPPPRGAAARPRRRPARRPRRAGRRHREAARRAEGAARRAQGAPAPGRGARPASWRRGGRRRGGRPPRRSRPRRPARPRRRRARPARHPGRVLGGAPESAAAWPSSPRSRPDSGLHASELIGPAAKLVRAVPARTPSWRWPAGATPIARRRARPGPRGRSPESLSASPRESTSAPSASASRSARTSRHALRGRQRSGDRRRDHARIAELVAETEAEIVVVGMPLSLDGSEGPAARSALAEVAELAATLPVPVDDLR
jgi:alanyl-tRNA synthetase